MRKSLIAFALIIGCLLTGKAQTIPSTTNFNSNWEFVKDVDTVNSGQRLSAKTTGINWEKVSLPHTPRIEPVNKVEEQWQGTCFYRKYFTIPVTNKGKHIALQFDAAMLDADIYLNGKYVSKHLGGFLPIYIDISNDVKFGRPNCVLMKLNNQDNPLIPPGKPIKDLDFNFYGGIYRNTWLIVKNKVHISNAVQANRENAGGILVHDDVVSAKQATLSVQTDINNDMASAKTVTVKALLMDKAGKVVATSLSNTLSVKANSYGIVKQGLTVNNPKLWSPTHPDLYRLNVQVLQSGKVIDEQTFNTGIRTVKFDASGCYINGEKINIVGTNRHQEYPYIGYALSDNDHYRDAYKIKQAGFNFVRCSHYPASPAFLDACDQLGIMVMEPIPGWQFFGGKEFQANSFRDIHDMMHRDRNHAGIVLWEASINETGMSKAYMDTANAIVHRELPYKDIFSSGWKDYAYDVFIPARQHQKAPDYWKKYKQPKPLLIAEYGDWEYYAQNAGFNQKDYEGLKKEERNSRQVRGDGQQRLSQQALNFQEAHNDDLYGPGVGDLNWVMFDYKRGYAADLETSGISDIFRVPKFSFYFYQSQYGPVADALGFGKPMVYVSNYWNDPAQRNVKVYSNCQQVELFLNGKSLGKQKPDTDAVSNNLKHAPFTFHPDTYTAGKLSAIGYINGKQAASVEIATPGNAYKIVLKTDISGKALVHGKNDHLFVYACVTDKDGNVVPAAANQIKLTIKGQGSIVGLNEAKAEAGIASFLLKAGDLSGKITIAASAGGLKNAVWNYDLK